MKKNYKQIIFYWVFVILGFPILFEFRNYYLGGYFEFLAHPRVLLFNTDSFFQLIFASLWPDQLPRLTAIFLVSSLLISLSIVLLPVMFRNFKYPGLCIIILSITMPSFLLPVFGYVPRNSIYLLPFAIIVFFLIANKIFQNFIKLPNLR